MIDDPLLIPIKVMGHSETLKADMIEGLISKMLGPQAHHSHRYAVACKGQYVSHTFWVSLEDADQENPSERPFLNSLGTNSNCN